MSLYKEHANEIKLLRDNCLRRGYKIFFKKQFVQGIGEGVVVSIIDPHDSDSVFFSCFLTWEQLNVVNQANSLFWRFLG